MTDSVKFYPVTRFAEITPMMMVNLERQMHHCTDSVVRTS